MYGMFESTVCNGFPVNVIIVGYDPGDPGYIGGLPENCWPREPAMVELELTTPKGDSCEWIERKMTDEDWERLEREAFNHLEE